MAISGVGIAVVTGGSLLIYAGLRDITPLAALKEVAKGKPTPVASAGSTPDEIAGTGGAAASPSGLVSGPGLSALVQGVQPYTGDRYSQLRRWADGYSDCSSFIGKGLKNIGLPAPGASTTWAFLASSQWRKIPASSASAGDLVVSTSHMVLLTGPGQAIGQQNPRRNVATGTVKDLMFGSPSYVYLRYAGPTGGAAGGKL